MKRATIQAFFALFLLAGLVQAQDLEPPIKVGRWDHGPIAIQARLGYCPIGDDR